MITASYLTSYKHGIDRYLNTNFSITLGRKRGWWEYINLNLRPLPNTHPDPPLD